MDEIQREPILAVLAELSEGSDLLIGNLAAAIAAVYGELGGAASLNGGIRQKVATERISALIDYCRESGRDDTVVISALVEIFGAISAAGIAVPVWFKQLIDLAAKRAIHSAEQQIKQELETTLVDRFGIFLIDRKTLCATPPGMTLDENLSRFADRVLIASRRLKPKRVVLVLENLAGGRKDRLIWKLLAEELNAMGISTKFVEMIAING